MNHNSELKLQSYLDGELSAREARQVEEWLATDSDAQLLLAELKNTKLAVSANEPELTLPESREFYWSKIQRQIEREAQTRTEPAQESIFGQLRKFFVPLAGAAAAVAIFAVVSNRQMNIPYAASEVETSDEMTAQVYRSQSDRMTVVWLEENSASTSEENSQDSQAQ